jgi:hypothetical protein
MDDVLGTHGLALGDRILLSIDGASEARARGAFFPHCKRRPRSRRSAPTWKPGWSRCGPSCNATSPGNSTTTSPCCSSNAAANPARWCQPLHWPVCAAQPGDVCAPSHCAGRRVKAGRRPVRKTRAARFDAAVKALRDPLPGRDNGRSMAGCRVPATAPQARPPPTS